VSTWAETSRALVSLGRKAEARELLSSWRTRRGVGMWTITNYIQSLSPLRREGLQEILATCRDALANLPHDHCARYLAHVQAESAVLLDDQQGFRGVWERYRPYFDCRETTNEWFEARRKHLLSEVPMMARYLQEGHLGLFRKMRRSWRWKHIQDGLHVRRTWNGASGIPWWTWLIVSWLVAQILIGVLNQR